MMTEEEAKAKWCPATMSSPAIYAPTGEGLHAPGPFQCLASACMAWRWAYDSEGYPILASNSEKKGFCGMAGRPE